MKHVVDTHALLWFLAGSSRLGTGADVILKDPASELVIPAIVLAEACWILERGRVPLTVPELLQAIRADPRIQIYPLDEAVVTKSQSMTAVGEMHDRLIVATALLLKEIGEEVELLTRDENITASGLVPVMW